MILNLQMGTVSFFKDFLSIPHVIKDYSMFVYQPIQVLFCSVLEKQMPFFHSLESMIRLYKFYRGVSQNMSSVFVWTWRTLWLFNIFGSSILGEKRLFPQKQSSGSSAVLHPPSSRCLCVVQWALLLLPSVKALHESPGQIKPVVWEVLQDLQGRFMTLIISRHLRQMSHTLSCAATSRLHLKCMWLKHLCQITLGILHIYV